MSRKIARERAYQLLFGQDFSKKEQQSFEETIKEMQKKDWVLNDEEIVYINFLCDGVKNNFNELKEIISNNLKGYTFSQLNTSDKTILLVAVFELKHSNLEPKIVINEAVELSKKYGLEKSYKFVNGVLSGVLK